MGMLDICSSDNKPTILRFIDKAILHFLHFPKNSYKNSLLNHSFDTYQKDNEKTSFVSSNSEIHSLGYITPSNEFHFHNISSSSSRDTKRNTENLFINKKTTSTTGKTRTKMNKA